MSILTVLILVLGVGAVWLLRLSRAGVSWAKPMVILCSIVVMVLAVARIWSSSGTKTAGEIVALHEGYQAVCGEILAASILERHPNARVTLLTPPSGIFRGNQALVDSLRNTLEEAGLHLTRQGLTIPDRVKDNFMKSNESAPSEIQQQFVTMMMADVSAWLDASLFNQALKDLTDQADVVICTFPFIATFEMDSTDLLKKGAGPALVMLHFDSPHAEKMLKNTVLDTVIIYNNDRSVWLPGAKMPKDKQVAFQKRYKLLTAESL